MNFPSSVWTLILSIKHDPERVKEQVVLRYRQPVHEFIQRRVGSHEDAEDLTQEVFLRICSDTFLEKVDPEKGRFRSLLLAVTRRVIASHQRQELAQRRDRRRQVPLQDIDLPADPPAEGEFDRLWVGNLVSQAMDRMKDEPHLVPLKLQIQGKSYREISEKLGRPETDVTNFIHRAKQRLRRELESLIREYSGGDVKSEIAALMQYL
ncbi:MAG TPA: RNA polymerase sigma factor [Planctomycetota bacterium]|nr:RNA polymerase sigma factor [Planctomycetota bacterium]